MCLLPQSEPDKSSNQPDNLESLTAEQLFELANKVENREPALAVVYAKKGLALARKTKDRVQEANHLGSLGYNYQVLGDYSKALRFQKDALSIRTELNDKQGRAKSLNNIGIVYYFLGHADLALDVFLQAMRLRNEINDENGLGKTYNNMGLVYLVLENYEKSMSCFEKALKIKIAHNDRIGETRTLSNMGKIFLMQNDSDMALKYQNQAKQIANSIGFASGVAYADNSIGEIYRNSGDQKQALTYYELAYEEYEKQADPHGMIESLIYMGGVLGEMGISKQAIEVLSHAVERSTEINAMPRMKDSHEKLSQIYREIGQYQKAFEHYQAFVSLQTKLKNEQLGIRISEMEMRYEMEKKERQIELLKKDRDIQDLTLTRQKALANSFLVGFFLVGLVAFSFFKAYQTKRLAHETLLQKNQLIAKSNEALALANQENVINHDKLKEAYQLMEVLAHTDPLTGLPNRRRFVNHCKSVILDEQPLCIVLGDMDRFKKINDQYGHDVGDEVLRKIADLLRGNVDNQGLACRWGGEEFILSLPTDDLMQAVQKADQLREDFSKTPIRIGKIELFATISFGVVQFADINIDKCIARADKLLYQAKASGGNNVQAERAIPKKLC